jgi:hypothetical protein
MFVSSFYFTIIILITRDSVEANLLPDALQEGIGYSNILNAFSSLKKWPTMDGQPSTACYNFNFIIRSKQFIV